MAMNLQSAHRAFATVLLLVGTLLPAAEPTPEERIARGAAILAANRLAADREDNRGMALLYLAAAMLPANEDVVRIRLRLEKKTAPDPIATEIDEERFLLYMLKRAEWLMDNRLEEDEQVGWTCLLYYLAADELLPEAEEIQVGLERLRAMGYNGNLRTLAQRGTKMARRGERLVAVRPAGVPEEAVQHDGHWYHVYKVKTGATWEEAQAACEAVGGQLASIETWEERRFVMDLVRGRTVWVGARFHKDQRSWRWLSGIKITNWRKRDDVRETGDRSGYYYLAMVRTGCFENRPLDGRIELKKWQEGKEAPMIEAVVCEWGD